MNVDVRDIHQTLEFRLATAIVRMLPVGLLMIFLALCIFALIDPDREPVGTLIGIGVCSVLGIAVIGFALWTRSSPGKPLFTLSPAGIHFRIAWVKEFLIPWREIQGVELDRRRGRPLVDALEHPHPEIQHDDLSRRHRGVGAGAILQLADLCRTRFSCAVRAGTPISSQRARWFRWHCTTSLCRAPRRSFARRSKRAGAFRDQPAIEPARTSVPSVTARKNAEPGKAATEPNPIAMGEPPKSMPWWEAVMIIALLMGIAAAAANIAGLGDLPGQAQDRVARAKARAERQYREESSRRIKEEWKKREADEEERRRKHDEIMRRTFGR